MIVFVYGTTAEAIKLAPVARRLQASGIPFEQWLTLQQADTVLDAVRHLRLPDPDHIIGKRVGDRPLEGLGDVLLWLMRIGLWLARHGRQHRRRLRGGVLVVHGDTMTSVVGAVMARVLGLDCAHVEAGLRSGDWRNPFPEELDRRIVGRLAQVHYAPNATAAAALRGRRNVVVTHGNTVIDAVVDGAANGPDLIVQSSDGAAAEPYGVVLLHRYEFLTSDDLIARTFTMLVSCAPSPAVVVLDDLARAHLGTRLAAVSGLRVVDKMPHAAFSELLASATYVVTDSGGVQEEAALLGVPTLVHRRTTERSEGLGANVVLSGWDDGVLQRFLSDPEAHRRPPCPPPVSPSDIVVEDLIARGYSRS